MSSPTTNAADPSEVQGASSPVSTGSTSAAPPTKHPWGLYVLFGTEMWERFSYYGMRALLMLYLIENFGMQPQQASGIYKWYTSLVYLTPLIGGFLADLFLGLRASIIIGGILMALGQFCLTSDSIVFFYVALGLLIVGNGFFKPNISTLVGRMYFKVDPRRDGAFTIFYMGINLGAFFAPIICGQWLRAHYGFKYGFAAAGIGMMVGLVVFLVFQKQIARDVAAAGNTLAVGKKDGSAAKAGAEPEIEEDEKVPPAKGLAPAIGRAFVILVGVVFGIVIPALSLLRFINGEASLAATFMPLAVAGITIWMTINLLRIKGAARDKSITIFVLFVFVVLFWMAFEQAGNALNLWAAYFTQRKVLFFEMEAEPYQSVNALGIFILAPIFAWMWTRLNRMKREPSTPTKMAIAMVFVALSFVAMMGAAAFENQTETRIALSAVPPSIDVSKLNAGRMRFESGSHELSVQGVLAPYVVSDALKQSANTAYVSSVEKLVEASTKAAPEHPVSGKLDGVPAEFEPPLKPLAAAKGKWDAATSTLTVEKPIDSPVKVALFSEGAPPEWRKALRSLADKSNAARVTGLWLFLSYLLATIGELCLSPVGLSMVTKLAPRRFASLFMGVWLLSSSVAQYAGGSIGESWGHITPNAYFTLFVVSSLVGAVLLFLLVRPLKRLMHNVA